MGERIYRLRPVHGFAGQTASTTIMMGAALRGSPVSTSQVVSIAIIGVGSAHRLNAVRWLVADRIITAWIVTIPASALMAVTIRIVLSRLGFQ